MSNGAVLCDDCDYKVEISFRIPDEIWAKINGGFTRLCIDCVDTAAKNKGIELEWTAKAKEPDA